MSNSGTGFVVSKSGIIVTCEHLIRRGYYYNKETNLVDSTRSIKAHFSNGKVIDMLIVDAFMKNEIERITGIVYDYILLKPKENTNKDYDYLKIGKWKEINVGDEVYTAGFPLIEKAIVVSKGILSSKLDDINKLRKTDGKYYNIRYNTSWADISSGKGNSGAPLIRLGDNYDDDIVVGIVFRNMNPFVDNLQKHIDVNKDLNKKDTTIDPTTNKTISFILETLAYNYYGFAGANPAENILTALQLLNQ